MAAPSTEVTLPDLPELSVVGERLSLVFPEGTPNRDYFTRPSAVMTVFVMLYIGAIQSLDRFIRPDQVTRMTPEQQMRTDQKSRMEWATASLRSSKLFPDRSYAHGSREQIRDETIRQGLKPVGAVLEREDLAPNSSKPRYALTDDFAALFDPALSGHSLMEAVERWSRSHQSAGARARQALLAQGAEIAKESVLIRFPNQESRQMVAGASSAISKAVIEDFAPRFLEKPVVVWLSDVRKNVVARDDEWARSIGLHIVPEKLRPDIVLVDLLEKDVLVVFVEVVATGGPITEARRKELRTMVIDAGYREDQVAYVTAYLDRDDPAFKRTISRVAWGSFAWFLSEPRGLLALWSGEAQAPKKLSELLR